MGEHLARDEGLTTALGGLNTSRNWSTVQWKNLQGTLGSGQLLGC